MWAAANQAGQVCRWLREGRRLEMTWMFEGWTQWRRMATELDLRLSSFGFWGCVITCGGRKGEGEGGWEPEV